MQRHLPPFSFSGSRQDVMSLPVASIRLFSRMHRTFNDSLNIFMPLNVTRGAVFIGHRLWLARQ